MPGSVLWPTGAGLRRHAWLGPSPDSTVTGYRLHYGTATKSYSTSIAVGNQTSYTVTGLGAGTFYFAVTSQYLSGTQSSYSNEVSKTIVAAPPASGSLAHSGTMTANSQNFAADFPVYRLWDGCLDGTSACSAGNSGVASSFWVEFDFGQNLNLSSARLFGDADDTWISSNWTLLYRENATDSWKPAFSAVNAFFNGGSTQSLAITARYVRVEVAGNTVASALKPASWKSTERFGLPHLLCSLPQRTNCEVRQLRQRHLKCASSNLFTGWRFPFLFSRKVKTVILFHVVFIVAAVSNITSSLQILPFRPLSITDRPEACIRRQMTSLREILSPRKASKSSSQSAWQMCAESRREESGSN